MLVSKSICQTLALSIKKTLTKIDNSLEQIENWLLTFSWCQKKIWHYCCCPAGTYCWPDWLSEQNPSVSLPQMAAVTRQTSYPAVCCWEDTKPPNLAQWLWPGHFTNCSHLQGLTLDRQCCKVGTGGTQRNPKEIWALRQWLCISSPGLLDTPHGKLKGGGEFLISNIACASLLYCTRNSLHSLLALLLLILRPNLPKCWLLASTGLSLDNRIQFGKTKCNVYRLCCILCADVYNDAEH